MGKKEKHTDPDADEADWFRGDQWDFVALDPDSRLVLEVVVGKRLTENAELLLEGVKGRLGGRPPRLVVSDEFAAYRAALLAVFGEQYVPPRTGKPGRPPGPRVVLPDGLCHATIHKTRRNGRVVSVEERVVSGERPAGAAVSTSYVERQNGSDRHRNARKGRKTYRFSKDWDAHHALTMLTQFGANFCWPVRTLRQRGADGRWRERTPAMAAGLTDHVWSWEEWFTLPVVQRG